VKALELHYKTPDRSSSGFLAARLYPEMGYHQATPGTRRNFRISTLTFFLDLSDEA